MLIRILAAALVAILITARHRYRAGAGGPGEGDWALASFMTPTVKSIPLDNEPDDRQCSYRLTVGSMSIYRGILWSGAVEYHLAEARSRWDAIGR